MVAHDFTLAAPVVETVTLTLTAEEANRLTDYLFYTNPIPGTPGSTDEVWRVVTDVRKGLDNALARKPHVPSWHAEVEAAVKSGRRILAIKEVRTATGWGLKDSKDYVDEHWPTHVWPMTGGGPVQS